MVTTEQLRKLIEEKKVTIGTDATTRALKAGQLKKIVLANNAPARAQELLGRFTSVTKLDVEKLNVANDELGVMCKKPFAISVLGIKK